MPSYDIICHKCGKTDEIYRRLSEFDNRPTCCGEKMAIKLTPVNVQQDIAPYKSMLTGQMITSRSEHRRHLKSHGCIEVGNEQIKPPKPFQHSKQEKYELRREIAQRLDAAR